jgi:hypothetical protein
MVAVRRHRGQSFGFYIRLPPGLAHVVGSTACGAAGFAPSVHGLLFNKMIAERRGETNGLKVGLTLRILLSFI